MDGAGRFVAWMGKALSTLRTGSAIEAALTSTFVVSGTAALLIAAFSVILPRTPPAVNTEAKFAPFEAMKLLAVSSILVVFIVTLLDSLLHSCYFFWTGPFFTEIGLPQNWIAPAMSIGQVAEVLAVATLGLFLKRLGWRMTMVIGVLGQGLRFVIYSMGTPRLLWLVIASNIFHGFAYACLFATVYIFVDETFPKDAHASAQGLFNILILGVGPFQGNFLRGWLGIVFGTTRVIDGETVEVVRFHWENRSGGPQRRSRRRKLTKHMGERARLARSPSAIRHGASHENGAIDRLRRNQKLMIRTKNAQIDKADRNGCAQGRRPTALRLSERTV